MLRRQGAVVLLVTVVCAYLFFWPTKQVYQHRTVAVADLHGDYDHMLAVLRHANILAHKTTEWIAGDDVLVSTGDSVDRGDGTIQIYRLYQKLQQESIRSGGRVVNLLGNHEVMNALHDWRYVTSGDIASFGGEQERKHAMSADGWVGKLWLDEYNVTANVPLLPSAAVQASEGVRPLVATFVHGGITPHWAKAGIDQINALGHSLLLKALNNPDPYHVPMNLTKEEAALWGTEGPFWFRGYASDTLKKACKKVDKALDTLESDYMVMGHTPSLQGFQHRCNDSQIFVIDTGISRAYGGRSSALQILARYETRKTWTSVHHALQVEFSALYVGHPTEILHTYRHSWS
ncbi:hypothetical protein MPSI1_003651 [Malassezia psittaci]|uniref:Calcineurin-like phosphoesterase domain-containing protein n=1 Tax=Malassezia psittaci TaxID=1821823 RepID=A0AAF0FCP1_9BASI|nr:hypothetical protein MPSI1_003651 [Malassezia psittaci]